MTTLRRFFFATFFGFFAGASLARHGWNSETCGCLLIAAIWMACASYATLAAERFWRSSQ